MKILEMVNELQTTTYRINPEIIAIIGNTKGRESNYRMDYTTSCKFFSIYEYVLGNSRKNTVYYMDKEFYRDWLIGEKRDYYDWSYAVEISPTWMDAIIEIAKHTGCSTFIADEKIKTQTFRINHDFLLRKMVDNFCLTEKALVNITYVDIVEHSNKYEVYIYNMSEEKNNLLTIPKHLYHKTLSFHDAYMIILDNLRYTDCIANFLSR